MVSSGYLVLHLLHNYGLRVPTGITGVLLILKLLELAAFSFVYSETMAFKAWM